MGSQIMLHFVSFNSLKIKALVRHWISNCTTKVVCIQDNTSLGQRSSLVSSISDECVWHYICSIGCVANISLFVFTMGIDDLVSAQPRFVGHALGLLNGAVKDHINFVSSPLTHVLAYTLENSLQVRAARFFRVESIIIHITLFPSIRSRMFSYLINSTWCEALEYYLLYDVSLFCYYELSNNG